MKNSRDRIDPSVINSKKPKCVMILSDKSSGSSILHRELLKHKNISTVRYTRHYESETLYWNKVAAFLGLPQPKIRYSELPLNPRKAKKDLELLIKNNLPSYQYTELNKQVLFDAWKGLCEEYGPVFLEKSPHHLYYSSALDLIVEMSRESDVEHYFIGLVRNPMAALYSSWRRWRANPDTNQFEWYRSYENLIRFKRMVGNKLMIVQYEELVSNREKIKDIVDFIGLEYVPEIGKQFHSKSINKWVSNKYYGFVLSQQVRLLANSLGYSDDEMHNRRNKTWLFYRLIVDGRLILYEIRIKLSNLLKRLKLFQT